MEEQVFLKLVEDEKKSQGHLLYINELFLVYFYYYVLIKYL